MIVGCCQPIEATQWGLRVVVERTRDIDKVMRFEGCSWTREDYGQREGQAHP